MFRFFQTITKRSVADNFIVLGLGFVGFMGGLLMSMFVFGPALMATLSSPKLDTNSYGKLLKEYLSKKDFKSFFELIFSWAKVDDQHRRIISERALYPIIEFFVPPVTCRSLPTLEIKNWDFDDIAVSLWCYIPMIMFLVPALIQSGKEKKWSHYIGFALVVLMLFTPFMYFATMGFTNGYARWTLFIPAVLIPYVSIYLDKIPNVSKWHIHLGFAFSVLGIVAAWLLTYYINGKKLLQFNTYNGKYEPGSEFIFRFTEDGKNYTNAVFIIELIYVLGVYLTFFFLYNKKKAFTIIATVFVSAEAVAVGNFVTIGHGYDQSYNNGYAMNNRFKSLLNKIKKTDKSFFRMYASIGDGVSTNNGLMNGYGTGSFFHSLYNFEVNDFTRWTFMRNSDKSVGGTYRGKWQDLDNLLGVKYYVISKEKSRYGTINYYYPNGYKANVPYEFEENKDLETSEYKVYVNNKQNGFGYAYDNVYHGKLNVGGYSIEAVKNSISLDTTAVVEDDAAEEIKNKYSSINLSETKPEVTMSYLYMNNHYRHNVYQIHKEDARNEWDEWAKNLEFEKIATIPDHPESFEKITNYKQDDAMKYFAFYTAKTAGEPLFKAGTTLYAYAPYGSDQRYNFFFIGKDDNGEYKVFMTDDHDDENTDNTSYMRGFYITKDVYRIAVMGKWRYSNLRDSDIRLYTEYQENYENRVEALRANPITDISYSKDTFKFRTNYTSNKFVVSQIAFDAGWKIKAVNNQTKEKTNIKVYKGNGGFVSFIAPVGDYSYTMSYETPYLAVSYLVSTVSFIGFFTSMLAYQMYQEKKRNHYLDELYREN